MYEKKVTVTENITLQTLYLESGLRTAPDWPKIRKKTMTSQFADMKLTSNFFDVVLFIMSSLVTGPSFMSMSSLVLELWQFSFIRDWSEIRKSEIPPSEFCPISGDWGKLWISNLAKLSLIECYWMMQNSRVTAFTVFEFKGNPTGGVGGWTELPPPPTQIRVNPLSVNFTSNNSSANCQRIVSVCLSILWDWHLKAHSKIWGNFW